MNSEGEETANHQLDGKWNSSEHHQFLRAVMKYGKNWKLVEKQIQSRNGSQIRSHSQKFFMKLNKFSRERKKALKINLNRPQLIEQQMLKLFSSTDITPRTPPEILNVLITDWENLPALFDLKKKQTAIKKQLKKEARKNKARELINRETGLSAQQNSPQPHLQKGREYSYFVKILKNQIPFLNKTHRHNLFSFDSTPHNEHNYHHGDKIRKQINSQYSQSFLPHKSRMNQENWTHRLSESLNILFEGRKLNQ